VSRPQSPHHHRAVIGYWRGRLLSFEWPGRSGLAAEALLAAALSSGQSEGKGTKAIDGPVRELLRAIAGVRESGDPARLDDWIDRYLVQRGENLLVGEAVRRAIMARVRDAHRRQAHKAKSLHSARIEMSKAAWDKLAAIRRDMQGDGEERVSVGVALESIVSAYRQRAATSKNAARSPATETIFFPVRLEVELD
jgi:hypothetical protein